MYWDGKQGKVLRGLIELKPCFKKFNVACVIDFEGGTLEWGMIS